MRRATPLPFLLVPVPLLAQGAVAGTVREDSTGRPLAGVEVLIGNRRTGSDGRGRYVLDNVANGEHIAEPSTYLALWTRRKP